MKLSLLLPLMKKSDQRLVMGQRKVLAMNYNKCNFYSKGLVYRSRFLWTSLLYNFYLFILKIYIYIR